MAIRFIDEKPKTKIRFIDEEPQRQVGLTGVGKFLPTFISGQTPARGERTLLGNIFERPGAVSREAMHFPLPAFGSYVSGFSGTPSHTWVNCLNPRVS